MTETQTVPAGASGTQAATRTRHAVSVSIGSSSRDANIEIDLLGHKVHIERRGTDGDLQKAAKLIRELDGKVDAIGLGGLDLFFMAAGRRYYLRQGVHLAGQAKETPVVCGAGLKDTLERVVVEKLDERIGWAGTKVLMLGAVDRFGMAEALDRFAANVRYGDLMFALGLPIPLDRLSRLELVAKTLLPVVCQLPISWFYPTGKQQESGKSSWRSRHFEWAEVIAGDFHFIKRHASPRLDGKIILTNTTTQNDVDDFRSRGVSQFITTTPRFEGRSLPTNLLEAALIAVTGRHPLSGEEYRRLIEEAGLEPRVEA